MTLFRPYISPSALDQFSCRLQWYWSRRYTSIRINPDLELGIGVHVALERFYSKGKNPVKVFKHWADGRITELNPQWEEDLTSMKELRVLGVAMLEGYINEYKGKEQFKVVATEHTCTGPILTPKGEKSDFDLQARVDAIVEDTKLHQLFVLEHKTFTYFYPAQLNRDHQFIAEVYAANRMCKKLTGKELSGLIYNGLRKQLPTPRVKNALYERHYVYVNVHQIRTFMRRAYFTAKMMFEPKLPIYPEPNVIRCNQCYFREPCDQYMIGGDYEFTLSNLFTRR